VKRNVSNVKRYAAEVKRCGRQCQTVRLPT
jgi:hypothetical protein